MAQQARPESDFRQAALATRRVTPHARRQRALRAPLACAPAVEQRAPLRASAWLPLRCRAPCMP